MIDLKVFIPSIYNEALKAEQLRLYKEGLLRTAAENLPDGIADGDLVELIRAGSDESVVLRVDTGTDKAGWIALSFKAAGQLGVSGGKSYRFDIRRVGQDDPQGLQSRHDSEVAGNAAHGDDDLIKRLAGMEQTFTAAVAAVEGKVERNFSHAVSHRDDTRKNAKSGTNWAMLGIAVSVLLAVVGFLATR